MKKLLALALSLMMIISLAACGGSKDTASSGSSDTAGKTDEPANTDEVITLVSTQAGSTADSVLGQGTAKFEELLEEYSGGLIQVEFYYDT